MRFYTNVVKWGNKILYRGIDNGADFIERDYFYPTMFVGSNKPTSHTTIEGRFVEPIQPGTMKETNDWIEQYKDVAGFDIYGNERFLYQFLSEEYPQESVDYDPEHIRVATLDIECTCEDGFPDIQQAMETINLITVKIDNVYYSWGLGDFDKSKLKDIDGKKYSKSYEVHYTDCHSEAHLLESFLSLWKEKTPHIITGWNVDNFDIPYLVNRISHVLSEKDAKSLSPFNILHERKVEQMGRTIQKYKIIGISMLDYMDLYKKFTYTNQSSYRLDHIAHVELGVGKISYDEYDNIRTFYKNNWQKFVEYNFRDVEIVDKLEDKMKLIELCVHMAYDSKVNYEDIYSAVRTWDSIIYNHLKRDNIVVPMISGSGMGDEYAGAFVMEPAVGAHEWVMSFDLNSLYPHLIQQYNISPECLVRGSSVKGIRGDIDLLLDEDNLKEAAKQLAKDETFTPNGSIWKTNKQGFMGSLMQKMYDDRVKYKKEMLATKQELENTKDSAQRKELEKKISKLDNAQMAMKIGLNSAYGAFGNKYFRMYDVRIAEGVTMAGQLSIRWIAQAIEKYLNGILGTVDERFVIAADTDSVYIVFDKLVKSVFKGKDLENKEKIVNFLDKVAKEDFEPFINKQYGKLAKYTQAFAQKMQMGREVIADKGIWVAKKRYILHVYDNEGVRYAEPKMKIMGLETARSSTPEICRNKLEDVIKLIVTTDEDTVINFIEEFKKEFVALPIEDVAFPRGVKDLDKFYDPKTISRKSTPIQVHSSLVYNKMLKDKKLTKKYEIIRSGEKIKYVYLKEPNPAPGSSHVIAFISAFPKEFNMQDFIDYETQFEKAFIMPLKNILTVLGWRTEKTGDLRSFFEF
jgi:DNA polymerase elongation subunit (family B)